ncbi:MAG: hypothetical protein GEU78_02250 [Actinobacteria bacterium]|nr:hypothetical protein [Actinomycetota bacterium]
MTMPTRRRPIRGEDLGGDRVELEVSVARKLYTCPGCGGQIPIGAEHVFVRRTPVDGSSRYHQHWHTDCARPIAREMDLAGRRRN